MDNVTQITRLYTLIFSVTTTCNKEKLFSNLKKTKWRNAFATHISYQSMLVSLKDNVTRNLLQNLILFEIY